MKTLERVKDYIKETSSAPRCKNCIFLGFRDDPEREERCKKGEYTKPNEIACDDYKDIDEVIRRFNL